MEEYLEDAGVTGGNIDELKVFIEGKKENLRVLAVSHNGHTLLHTACYIGHLNLVEALLTHMREFATQKSVDDLYPLHIAAIQDRVEIVRALLKMPVDIVDMSVKGRDDKTPLHYASENGNLGVMEELLSLSPKILRETTAQKETVLHLAVNNNQLDAVKVLVNHLKLHHKEVINLKDNGGNTALHLAVAAKNYEVVDFMLDQHARRYVVVDVNAPNNCGKTPLDFLGREAEDRRIRKILQAAGAIHGRGRHSSPVFEGESRADIRNAMLVVAGLILNATYQSVLQPPDFKPDVDKTYTNVDKTYTKGFLAMYASWMTGFYGRELAYIVFITGNTFGLLVSVQMIISLTKDLWFEQPMLLSMAFMVQTYYCHTFFLPFTKLQKEFGLINWELFSVLPLTIPVLLLQFQKQLKQAIEFYLEEFPCLFT